MGPLSACIPKWQCEQEMPWQLSLGIAQVAKETVIIVAAFDSSDVFIECFRVYQLSIKEFISGNHETWLYLKKKKKKKVNRGLRRITKGGSRHCTFFCYPFWKKSWLTWLKTFSGSKPLTLQDCLLLPHIRASPDWYICSVSSSSNFIFSIWKHVLSRRPFRIPAVL